MLVLKGTGLITQLCQSCHPAGISGSVIPRIEYLNFWDKHSTLCCLGCQGNGYQEYWWYRPFQNTLFMPDQHSEWHLCGCSLFQYLLWGIEMETCLHKTKLCGMRAYVRGGFCAVSVSRNQFNLSRKVIKAVRHTQTLALVASPELSKTMALRQTNSSGLSLSMRKREVVASSMSKISAIPSTQSPSLLDTETKKKTWENIVSTSELGGLFCK